MADLLGPAVYPSARSVSLAGDAGLSSLIFTQNQNRSIQGSSQADSDTESQELLIVDEVQTFTRIQVDTVSLSAQSQSALKSVQEEIDTGRENGQSLDDGQPDTVSASQIRSLLKDVLGGLDEETAKRVGEQVGITINADGLRELAAGNVSSGSTGIAGTLTGNGQSYSGSSFADLSSAMSSELFAYLELIRQLDGDSERINAFLDAIDESYESGAGNLGEAMSEAMASISADMNAEGIQIEGSISQSSSTVITFAGEEMNVQMNISAEGTITFQEISVQQMQTMDPLVLDLDGDGVEVSTAAEGVEFDLDGDGVKEQAAFATGDDAFLVLDRNGNGMIDDGRELFGDQNGAANGLAELAKFDDNHDGRIDAQDSIYNDLQLYSDRNADGISQNSELISLAEAGIESIDLHQQDFDHELESGNRIAQISSFTRTDGTRGMAADVLLQYMA